MCEEMVDVTVCVCVVEVLGEAVDEDASSGLGYFNGGVGTVFMTEGEEDCS